MNGPTYSQNDLIMLIGQCTVELAYLRAKVAQLEALSREMDDHVNGVVEAPAVEVRN